MILRHTIWGALEKNIRLGFRKGCLIPKWFVLLLIKQKNQNKRFGEFEFEYFGGSDVANKLYVVPSTALLLSASLNLTVLAWLLLRKLKWYLNFLSCCVITISETILKTIWGLLWEQFWWLFWAKLLGQFCSQFRLQWDEYEVSVRKFKKVVSI